MEILVAIIEEVIRVLAILEDFYHAWKVSPHSYVIVVGRLIFVAVVMMIVVVIWAMIFKIFKKRRKR